MRMKFQNYLLDKTMKYRKKPVIIEAIQWLGNNKKEIADFAGESANFEVANEKEKQLFNLLNILLYGALPFYA